MHVSESRLAKLRQWIESLPEGSELTVVFVSIFDDDAQLIAEDPSGKVYSHEIMGIKHRMNPAPSSNEGDSHE